MPVTWWNANWWNANWWNANWWATTSTAGLGTLYEDRVVTVVKFTLVRKDGTGSDTYYVSEDHWAAASLYSTPSSNPVIYPIVAEPIATPRSFEGAFGVRHDVQMALYGKTHLDRYSRGFVDLLENYLVRSSTAEVLRYRKPAGGLGTPLGANGVRQTLELTGVSWEPESGILRVNARDTWYEDKEVSKRFNPSDSGLSGMQDDYEFEYGAIPFGNGASSNGVVIEAPYVSETEAISGGSANLFCGFGTASHPVDSIQKVYSRNTAKRVDDVDWPEITTLTNHAVAYEGDDYFTDLGDAYPRHLSLYSRGKVITPTGNHLLAMVACQLRRAGGYWAADFSGSNNLYIIDPNGLGLGDKDFTVSVWGKFDQLREQAIVAKGNLSDTTAEWGLYMNSANKPAFYISTNGTAKSVEAVWGSALGTGSWYRIDAWHDSAGDTVNINVNHGTAVSAATAGAVPFQAAGPFQVGYTGGVANHLDGKVTMLGFWNRVVASADRATIYNTGNGKAYGSLTDAEKTNLVSWWNLSEFDGKREDQHSSRDLSDAASVGSAPGIVATTLSSEKGEVKLTVSVARYLADTDTYAPEGSALREAFYDLNDLDALNAAGHAVPFAINPPLELINGVPYFVFLEFTNSVEHAHSVWANYRSSTGSTHYARLNDGTKQGWVRQTDVELAMGLWTVGLTGSLTNSGASPYHAYQGVASYGGSLSGIVTIPAPTKDREYKVGVRGLRDDTSGTYTGTPSSVMRNPADLLRFFLLNGSQFLGVPSAQVSSGTFTTVRTALGNSYDMSFAVERQTKGDALNRKVCEQSDLVMFKTRDGKLTLQRETWHGGNFQHVLTQAAMQHELRVLSVVETPLDRVYNDFRINFGIDPLNQPKDPALVRRAGSDSFSAAVYLSPTEASSGDADRQFKLLQSQNRYGVLEYRADFDCYAADSTAPPALVRRLADKYYLQRLRVTISVPLKDYYDIDLLNTVSVRHVDLPLNDGTSESVVWHNGGSEVSWHNAGVPVVWMKLGKLEGQVVSLVEQDQEMRITVETANPF